MDTLINPRAVMGGNEPPLADRLAIDHADLLKEAKEAEALVPAQIRAIETDEEAAGYTDTAVKIKEVIAQADAAFKVEKAPWLEGGRTVDNTFAFRKDLDAATGRITRALNIWGDLKLARQRAAEAIEAARLKAEVDAEAERLRKEAAAFDEPIPEPVAPVYVAPVAAKDVVRVVSAATGSKSSGTVKWEHEILDFEKVPRQFLMVNDKVLKAHIDGLKAQGMKIENAKIEGVRIFEAVKTTIRR